MKFFFALLCILQINYSNADQNDKKQKNYCVGAINKNTLFKVTGVYGSNLESEWHPSAVYVLLKEMKKFLVLENEYVEKNAHWNFLFVDMSGGRKIVFVFHNEILKNYCMGPNAFFIERK